MKQEKDVANSCGANAGEKKDGQCNAVKTEKDAKDAQRAKEQKVNEAEVRELKNQLKYVFCDQSSAPWSTNH